MDADHVDLDAINDDIDYKPDLDKFGDYKAMDVTDKYLVLLASFETIPRDGDRRQAMVTAMLAIYDRRVVMRVAAFLHRHTRRWCQQGETIGCSR
jgi:hypothetical protein